MMLAITTATRTVLTTFMIIKDIPVSYAPVIAAKPNKKMQQLDKTIHNGAVILESLRIKTSIDQP